MTVASNRMLGGIGSLLMTSGVVGALFGLADLFIPNPALSLYGAVTLFGALFDFLIFIGFILFFIGMYGLSRDYNEQGIFNNVIYSIISAVIMIVLTGVVLVFAIVLNSINNAGSSSTNPIVSTVEYASSGQMPPTQLLATPLVSIATIVMAIFLMRAFNQLSIKTEVSLFKTGGKILLYTSILTFAFVTIFAFIVYYGPFSLHNYSIVTQLAGLVQYIAWATLTIAFSRIKPPPTPLPVSPPSYFAPTTPITQPQIKYCTRCGAPNQMDSQYCIRCGQKLT